MDSSLSPLTRQGSSVPVSTHQTESTVLAVPVYKAWALFKTFNFEKVVPGIIKKSEWVSGGANQLDSVVRISYTDGAVWDLNINEISDRQYTIGYQVVNTEPAHLVTSISGYIRLISVTDE